MGELIKRPIDKTIKKKAKKKRIKKSGLQKRRENPRSGLWDKKAMWEWGRCIREKFQYKCAICESSQNVQAHHLITRDHVLTRHDLMNGILLCVKHHTFDSELSAHKGQVGFGLWMQEHRPIQWAWVIANRYKRKEQPYNYEDNYNVLVSLTF